MIKEQKKAFTLTELSVVIVVVSVLITLVAIGRGMLSNATAVKLQQEADSFKKAINAFYITYSTYPGLSSNRVHMSIGIPAGGTINQKCSLSGYNYNNASVAGNEGITAQKSITSIRRLICAIYELRYAGLIDYPISTDEARISSMNCGAVTGDNCLFSTVSGVNIPISKSISDASLYVMNNGTGIDIVPYEWYTTHSSNNAIIVGPSSSTTYLPSHNLFALNGGVEIGVASYLDYKFDDGLPYSGLISSGRELSRTYLNFDKSSSSDCTMRSGGSGAGFTASDYTADYSYSKNKNARCVMAFIF